MTRASQNLSKQIVRALGAPRHTHFSGPTYSEGARATRSPPQPSHFSEDFGLQVNV